MVTNGPKALYLLRIDKKSQVSNLGALRFTPTDQVKLLIELSSPIVFVSK